MNKKSKRLEFMELADPDHIILNMPIAIELDREERHRIRNNSRNGFEIYYRKPNTP